MSGKKGKKTKGKTMNLQDFLGDTPGVVTVPKMKSWADSTEDDDEYGYVSRKNDAPVVLPTAPRAARDQSINEENIPTSPPFVAYISNLPYDVDEQDLAEFFQDMNVHSMRLPKDANKFKGYGYVEFEDRQSLINALSMVDTNLKNRRVRIEVSNSSNDERRGRMGRMGERRDYMDDPERTTGDWRSARSNDDGPDDGGGGRDDRYRSRGFDRRDDDRSGGGGFEDSKPGNWRDGPRDMAAMDRPRPTFRDSRPGPGDDRGGERDWNRFADRGRGNRDRSRELDGDRGGSSFGPRRTFGDDSDRDRERWSSVRSQPRDNLDGPPPSSDAPRTRPTLNLQPRTKPIDNAAPPKGDSEGASSEDGDRPSSAASNSAPAPAPVPAANIFGAAKPVDTAAREREIEERLAKSAEARLKEKDSDRRGAPRETWGRRNGEGRDDDSRSRPTWRSSDNRGTFDRSEGRQPMSRDNRDQRDYKDHRESNEPQDAGEPGETREIREPREPREPRADSRGSSANRGAAPPPARGPPKQVDSRPPPDGAEREKKKEEDEISRMPKAKDDQAPNFVASNKYSMLPDDVDPDNVEE